MARQLKDILKQAHDTIKGVNISTTSQGELGKDPGVDYDPKAGDEQEFVAAHSVQKWDDPVGNKNYANDTKYSLDNMINHRLGNTEKKAKASEFKPVKEAKEEMKCNHSPKGTVCPVHGIAECMTVKSIKENATDHKKERLYHIGKAAEANIPMKLVRAHRAAANLHGKAATDYTYAHDAREASKKLKEEFELDEVLTKSTTAGETIHDFVHSKNLKFAGKSKEERIKMALGTKYGMMRKEETDKPPFDPDTTNPHPKAKDKNVAKKLARSAIPKPIKEDGYPVQPLLGSKDSEDYGVDMVKTELRALANKAMHLVTQMPETMHVEPWVQAKIAQAKEMVSSVHDYMIYGDHEEDEQMDTPMTFPNMSVDVNTGQNV
jgi:hypothetical protein